MTEESVKFNSKWEPTEFVLTVNGNIACQRFIKVENFRHESLTSLELLDAVRSCVDTIKENLRNKSVSYMTVSAPLSFENKTQAFNWLSEHGWDVPVGKFILIRKDKETVETYAWTGIKPENEESRLIESCLEKYEGFYCPVEFSVGENEKPCLIEFSLNRYGKKICSEVWDGTVYPRFIRTNIDLSNSKNRYKSEERGSSSFEAMMIDYITNGQPDLVPIIADILSKALSYEKPTDYTRVDHYGNTTYNLNINGTNNRRIREAEAYYKEKTDKYFKHSR